MRGQLSQKRARKSTRRAVGGRRSTARDVPPHGPGDRGAFPAQPSPADPDGEDQDKEQRQSWSELDEEQEEGHRPQATGRIRSAGGPL